METLWQDLRYGFRMLLKKPGFTAVAVLALALGIGANTSIFSVVNGVLLRPLPFPDPDRLVLVWENNLQKGWDQFTVSPPNYVSWREQNKVFEQIAAFRGTSFNLTGIDEPERIQGSLVSASFLPLVGINPALGRVFLPEEDQPGKNQVVIMSHNLWQRRFGADPEIIGKTLTLNSKIYTVIGVMPPNYSMPSRTELWSPIAFDSKEMGRRGSHYTVVIARLKSGIKLEQAQAEMSSVASALEQQYPDTNKGWGVVVVSLFEAAIGDIRTSLLLMLGAVGFVLLIACTNVANLLLARATARQREIAIRSALGAGRFRIMRQLLTESILLGLLGGIFGLLLALWGTSLIAGAAPDIIPRAKQIGIDHWVLGFTFALSLLTGMLFGLVPALQASKVDLNESLKEGGRAISFSRHRLRSMLVISEIALALVLLVGAGLLIKSFINLQRIDPGFSTENILKMTITLPAKYETKDQQAAFFRQVLEKVKTLPGVESAGATTAIPLGDNDTIYSLTIEGEPDTPDNPSANYYQVSSDFFSLLKIPLMKGRYFTEQDNEKAARVVIINQTMARRLFSNQDPIGKRLRIGNEPEIVQEIVGIVGDVKHYGLTADITMQMYVPYLQRSASSMDLVVRTASNPAGMTGTVRSQILAVDKDQPVYNVKTMEEIVDRSLAQRRLSMMLLSIFAAVALILAAVGIYGVMSYSVTQRTHEIGIRMALGAHRRDILKLVVKQGMVLALVGIIIGLIAAFAVTRIMSSLLYGISATDPVIFLLISLLFASVALLANYIPARRATKVDPMVALRYE